MVLLHLSVLYVACFTIRALLVSGTDNTPTPSPSAFTSQSNHVQQNPATPVVNVAASTCIAPVPLSSGHFVVRTVRAVCGCIKYSHVGKYFRLLHAVLQENRRPFPSYTQLPELHPTMVVPFRFELRICGVGFLLIKFMAVG